MSVRFTKDHEWIKVDGKIGTVGITQYAQAQLGDIVFVELPAEGTTFDKGDDAAVVESVKAAADIYMPVEGEIVEINQALKDDPALANRDPMGEGWFFKMALADRAAYDALLDEAGYQAFLDTL